MLRALPLLPNGKDYERSCRMKNTTDLIKALDCCLDIVRSGRWAQGCIACPYNEKSNCREQMLLDAIKILKGVSDEVQAEDDPADGHRPAEG